ncbi:hypothetical protein ASC64_12230 [Nocardioides sp. Root122]|uniref:lysoplasmalogenase n=1 Tax=Nocardioides TaxID=1839 RepID=UPI0007028405|nr:MULTISPECIES: lysoplasmalogenase [Nocardioides]KQV67942.1 hypothetical protein ASC64_12230 [Nocardioides sp. Root122]MCK9823900.1 lysoplasmalogenase [Nocardioides cavernae]
MLAPRAVSYVLLVLVAVVHLLAQLVAPEGVLAEATQPLLMPALAAVLVVGTPAPRPALVRVTLVALFFSWLGDTLPRLVSSDTGFLLMIGCFLLAQLAYICAFWGFRTGSVLGRPLLLAPYAVALVALVATCRAGAGGLLPAVVVYGTALAAMAVLATGLGRVAGIGGAVFMLSDALIALRAFADVDLPAHSFWVMLTYVVGQGLLVVAVRSRAADADCRAGLVSVA